MLKRTGADVYARSPAEWQQRCAAAAAVRSDFAAMLGDEAPAALPAGNTAGAEGATDTEQEAAPPADGGKKAARKRAKAAAPAAAPATEADGAAAEPEPAKKKVRRPCAMDVHAVKSPDPNILSDGRGSSPTCMCHGAEEEAQGVGTGGGSHYSRAGQAAGHKAEEDTAASR